MKLRLLLVFAFTGVAAIADPQLTSWHAEDSGNYARIYQSVAAETARLPSTTWSRGTGIQSLPTYAGVSEVSFSTGWVYIRSTGLAGHLMGPWYLDAAKSQNFPNFPSNTAKIYRIPRNPVIPAAKTLTGLGATGCMVNGVSMFDARDAFSYVGSNSIDATPVNGLNGDGVWNRDGYHNEGVSFDPALAHQAGNNYHYHAQPIGLRDQLGDHVDYDPVTNRYTESTAPLTQHSPILAWAADGLPVYGPYGYSTPLDPDSGIRRMVSGFVLRNGDSGTTNLTNTGRTTLPAWAQRIQTVSFKNGPVVSSTFALGHYIEDFDYLGDRGFTHGIDFDLNEQNVRWCVTPEFPSGTYAYFTPIHADGTPAFPYTTGRQFFASPTGGSVTAITESITKVFEGGPNKKETADVVANAISGDVTLTWSAVEGGTYLVEASIDLTNWPDVASGVIATSASASIVETGEKYLHPSRFYRVSRSSLAPYDAAGFSDSAVGGTGSDAIAPGGSAALGSTVTLTITLPSTPPNPPANLVPSIISLGGTIPGTAISRPTATTAKATFVIPSNFSVGAQNVVVTFTPGPTYTLSSGFTFY